VLIDVTRLLGRALKGRLPTGVDRVSLAYVEHFLGRANALVRFAGRWMALNKSDSRRVFDGLLEPHNNVQRMIRWHVGRHYALSWGRHQTPRLLLSLDHNGLDQPGYAANVRRSNIIPVFFLHDLIPITHPEYSRPGAAEKHRQCIATMLAVGRGLILNSLETRRALENFAARQGWHVPPCVVAPLAPARLPDPSDAHPLGRPYFVILGTIEPRKNHLLLLHVWRQLVDELGDAAPRLAIVGQRGWECEQVVDLLDRCDALDGHVFEQSRCDDVELATWLKHAQALLFPSFTEGFGIPLIEALTLGTPVIASDLPVFYEIAGDMPEYLDTLDGPGWKRMVLEYTREDSPRRRGQRERIRGYTAPTWENHFAVVEQFLRELDVGF
jgi:glycosyltransferase involved in cell wall biosynthesis